MKKSRMNFRNSRYSPPIETASGTIDFAEINFAEIKIDFAA